MKPNILTTRSTCFLYRGQGSEGMSCFKLGTLPVTMGRENDGGFKLNGSSCVRLSVRRVIVWVAVLPLVGGGRLLVRNSLLNPETSLRCSNLSYSAALLFITIIKKGISHIKTRATENVEEGMKGAEQERG